MTKIEIKIALSEDFHSDIFELKQTLDGISPSVAGMEMNDFFTSCLEKGTKEYQVKLSNQIPDTKKVLPNQESFRKLYPWFTEDKNVQMSFEEFQLYVIEKTIYDVNQKIQASNRDPRNYEVQDSFWEYYLTNRERYLKANSIPYYDLKFPDGSQYIKE